MTASLLPMTKAENTKSFKNWLWKNGIADVKTEDDSMAIWERWLLKLQRTGRKTSDSQLNKMFKEEFFLKQVDIPVDAKRSSEVCWQCFSWHRQGKKRWVGRLALPVIITEHAVRRHWARIGKPDLTVFRNYINFNPLDTNDEVVEAMATEQGLWLGKIGLQQNGLQKISIETKTQQDIPKYSLRLTTFVAKHQFYTDQRRLWERCWEHQQDPEYNDRANEHTYLLLQGQGHKTLVEHFEKDS